jgi:hypothetical protein
VCVENLKVNVNASYAIVYIGENGMMSKPWKKILSFTLTMQSKRKEEEKTQRHKEQQKCLDR